MDYQTDISVLVNCPFCSKTKDITIENSLYLWTFKQVLCKGCEHVYYVTVRVTVEPSKRKHREE